MKCFGNILLSLLTIVMLYCCCEDENSKSDTTPKWEKVPVSTSDPYSDFMDVEFYNNDYGVICGGSGMILNTENGGFHWQSHKLGEGDLTSVFMLNEKEFFTGRELLYKTSNDGISFTRLGNETIFGSTLSGIYFFNSDNGLVAASSWIYKTNDGGKNWEAIFQKGFAHKFQFVTDSVGYIYGGATWDNNFYGELYKTDNCGNNWISLGTSPEVYNWEILAMYFINKDTGYIANYNHEVYITQDGGATWTKRCDNIITNIYDLVFLSEDEGYGVGYPVNGILKTTDGGRTWFWDYQSGTTVIESITKTPDNKKLIAVGSNGTILIKK